MSVTNSLYFKVDLEPQEVLRQCLQISGVQTRVHLEPRPNSEPIPTARIPGSLVYANPVNQRYRDFLEESYDFAPTVKLWFDIDKFDDVEALHISILQATYALIKETDWDIMLVFGDAMLMLLRNSGELQLNRASGFWIPINLEEVPAPYKLLDLPML